MLPNLHTKQRGAALIVSLLVLIVLTLLSLSAMNSAGLQQRMSGHLLDGQLAFESADAALRDGEQWLDGLGADTTPCAAVTAGCELYTLDSLTDLEGTDGTPWWLEVDEAWWPAHGHDFLGAGKQLPQHRADPQIVVEELARVPDSLVVGVIPPSTRVYYRITARGVGGSPWGETVVQSTFVKQANR
jgi:type IV pilus assembly protein PilX